MTDIIISEAPVEYRGYLTAADNKGYDEKRNNGKLDTSYEVRQVASTYCLEKSFTKCSKFLDYLEQAGQKFSIRSRWLLLFDPFRSSYEISSTLNLECGGFYDSQDKYHYNKNLSFLVLQLRETGLIEKYGFQAIGKLLKEACGEYRETDKRDDVYLALAKLADTKAFEKIGIDNLIEIIKSAGWINQLDVYPTLITMDKRGLLDKTGIPNLMTLAKTSGDYLDSSLSALIRLDEKKLVDKIGIANLLEIASSTLTIFSKGEDIAGTFLALGNLADRGLVDVIGVPNLVEIAKSARSDSKHVFKALEDLFDKGYIHKIGIANLVEFAKTSCGATGNVFTALGELGDKGLIEKIGIPNLLEIVKGRRKGLKLHISDAFRTLEMLAERGLIGKVGILNVVEFLSWADDDLIQAYPLIIDAFAENGLIKKFGLEKVKLLFDEIDRNDCVIGADYHGCYASFCGPGSSYYEPYTAKIRETYPALKKLIESGVIDQIGIDNLIEITKVVKCGTHKVYSLLNAGVNYRMCNIASGFLLTLNDIFMNIEVFTDTQLLDRDEVVIGELGINLSLEILFKSMADNICEAYSTTERKNAKKVHEAVDKILDGVSMHLQILSLYTYYDPTTRTSPLLEFVRDLNDANYRLMTSSRKSFIDEVGIANLVDIAKKVREKTPVVYSILRNLAEKGFFNELGFDNVLEIAQIIDVGSLSELDNLITHNLVEKIGISNLVEIAMTMKKSAGYIYRFLGRLAENDFLNKSNFPQIMSFLYNIYQEKDFFEICNILTELIENHLIDKIGLANFITIAETSRSSRAMKTLKELAKDGVIDRVGIANFVAIAEAGGKETGVVYDIFSILDDAGITSKFGAGRIVSLITELLNIPDTNVYIVYHTLLDRYPDSLNKFFDAYDINIIPHVLNWEARQYLDGKHCYCDDCEEMDGDCECEDNDMLEVGGCIYNPTFIWSLLQYAFQPEPASRS